MSPTYEYPYRAEGWEREIYPMPAFPTLTVADVERASRWYQEVLGFADVFTLRLPDGGSALAHLRWCSFGDVLLTRARQSAMGATLSGACGITLNFAATDVDAVAARARDAGAEVLEGPINRPWNTRDVTLRDLDGNKLNFTSPLRGETRTAPESFKEIMDRATARMSEEERGGGG